MKLLNLCLFLFVTSVFAQDFKEPKDTSYVAWKTRKRMFLFKEVKPVGVNTNINIKKSGPNFKLIVPKKNFDSGDQDRDAEVVVILGGKQKPNIEFDFVLDQNTQVNIRLGSVETIKGQIDVNGAPREVTFKITGNDDSGLKVKWKGKFSDFGIEPPKVAGGAVAKVYDELELFGFIRYSDLML